MTIITRDNFDQAGTLLTISTAPRSGVPDGNFHFDTPNDIVELLDVTEVAVTTAEANALTVTDKVQLLAVYFAMLSAVEADPALQNFLFPMDAVGNRMGKLVGAMAFLNGIKLADSDRPKLRDSGFTEFAASNGGDKDIDRIYHNVKSTIPVNPTTQCFGQLALSMSEADRNNAIPFNFSQVGNVNEVVQTFGDSAFGDVGAGDFDKKAFVLILGAREFGFEIAETTSIDANVTELGAYSQGYSLGNPIVTELSAITLQDIIDNVAPYNGLSFTVETTPVVHTGFAQADGTFRDTIGNSGGATLLEIRAWMDYQMSLDSDINVNTANTGVFRPKRQEPLYSINSLGKLVTRSKLFIEGIQSQDIILTDDSGTEKSYPFLAKLVFKLSKAWFDDVDGQFFRLMYKDGAGALDFNTATVVVAKDSSGADIYGDKLHSFISPDGVDYKAVCFYDYAGNTQAGLNANEDKQMVLYVAGSGGSKARFIDFSITETAVIEVDALTLAETN